MLAFEIEANELARSHGGRNRLSMALLNASRGHKRKLEEARADEQGDSASDSSKESNEDEEGSSSEADEMAAALEAELNDFM
ncbi:hypothetical protein SKAU_G00398830 [Synaphobranchus kaupii]|uniref:FCP1-like phosphatase C-terminal domain-containing protein n=1 Tax=Synaphobranchus kaupii TaxID=118154 RepID=A0A9Q1IC45_SYNKA|nr:hypothetical protein SKAU_G00398830 [Synaphobranchus kaupii]